MILATFAAAVMCWVAAFVVWDVVPPGPRLGCLRIPLMVTLIACGNGLLFLAIRLALR